MCVKRPDESTIIFFFRQLAENPLQVICTLAIGGLVFLYSDMREFMQSQTAAFNEFTTTLKEQNLRLEHLENYHLQELSKREINQSNKGK